MFSRPFTPPHHSSVPADKKASVSWGRKNFLPFYFTQIFFNHFSILGQVQEFLGHSRDGIQPSLGSSNPWALFPWGNSCCAHPEPALPSLSCSLSSCPCSFPQIPPGCPLLAGSCAEPQDPPKPLFGRLKYNILHLSIIKYLFHHLGEVVGYFIMKRHNNPLSSPQKLLL